MSRVFFMRDGVWEGLGCTKYRRGGGGLGVNMKGGGDWGEAISAHIM